MHDFGAKGYRGLLFGLALLAITTSRLATAQPYPPLPAAAVSNTTLFVQTASRGNIALDDELDFAFVLELVDPSRYTTYVLYSCRDDCWQDWHVLLLFDDNLNKSKHKPNSSHLNTCQTLDKQVVC